MKKSILSIMVIFTTIICIIVMLNSSGDISLRVDSISDFKNRTKDKATILSQSFMNYISTMSENKEEVKKNKMEGDKQESIDSNKVVKQESADNSKLIKQESSDNNKNIKEEDKSVTVNSVKKYNDVVLFKVPKEDIKNRISSTDRAKLYAVASKISPVDYLKIDNYLKSEDMETAVVSTIALLKMRLSKKEYIKFREVVNNYIDIEKVEKVIPK